MIDILPLIVRDHLEQASALLASMRSSAVKWLPGGTFARLCDRCEANLDALRVAGEGAVDLAAATMEDDAEVTCVVAFLLAETGNGQPAAAERAVALLRDAATERHLPAWWGMRLSWPGHVETFLRALAGKPGWNFASAAAADILAFHRLPVRIEIGQPPEEDGDEIAWLLAEAAGRVSGAWRASQLKQFLGHASSRVREAALRASARSGLRELPGLCRDAALYGGPLEAIELLGMVGSPEDVAQLERVASKPTAARAALSALGRLGWPAAVPVLLEFLSHAELQDCAATAIERITGQKLPRGTPPEPPPDLTEDELDLWEPSPPVDAAGARAWWNKNASSFDQPRRYQSGLCVSDDPLGPVFDHLPLAVRYDVYLRERALTPGTPDWELETWTWRQKEPMVVSDRRPGG